MEKIINILMEIMEDQSLEAWVTEDTSIIDDIGIDSLQMTIFILRVEEEFGIEIDFVEFDYECLQSIKSFTEFIEKQSKIVAEVL